MEINILDHVVTNDIRTNKNQLNDAIENEPKFDNIFNLYIGNKKPLTVVTVILQGGNKQTTTTISGLTCLWYSGATDSMIETKHTK